MRKLLCLISALLLISLLLGQTLFVLAFEYTNYTTTYVSESEKNEFLKKINFRSLDAGPAIYPFSCFAISEQGQIALGVDVPTDAQVLVYNSEGDFLYGFQFENNKCEFALFFEGEKLSIFWSRSRYIGSFDLSGNCLQLRKSENTKQNADSRFNDRNRPESGKIGDIQYQAEGVGLSINYSRLTIEDTNGKKTVIYDVMEQSRKNAIIIGTFFLCTTAIIVFTVCKNKKNDTDKHAENGSEECT